VPITKLNFILIFTWRFSRGGFEPSFSKFKTLQSQIWQFFSNSRHSPRFDPCTHYTQVPKVENCIRTNRCSLILKIFNNTKSKVLWFWKLKISNNTKSEGSLILNFFPNLRTGCSFILKWELMVLSKMKEPHIVSLNSRLCFSCSPPQIWTSRL
jgi:hypothetical protein